MSLLPNRIIPQDIPFGKVDQETGNVLIEKNWWLLIYNLCLNTIGTGGSSTSGVPGSGGSGSSGGGGTVAGLPSSALTELSALDSDVADSDAIRLRRDIDNALIFAQDALTQDAGGSTAGATGPQGPSGPAVFLAADDPEEVPLIPGPQGPAGAAGSAGAPGAQGPAGPALYLTVDEPDEPLMFPGVAGPSGAVPGGLIAFASGLTSQTTINDTTGYTTGGITLAGQAAATGSIWRVKAYGTFVATSSATARNAQLACFWGSTQLAAFAVPVLVSTARTTGWSADFILVGTSTTAIWSTGFFTNILAATGLATSNLSVLTPASTTVTAGSQTIDLRFSMSVAVATDQWVVQQVSIERVQ